MCVSPIGFVIRYVLCAALRQLVRYRQIYIISKVELYRPLHEFILLKILKYMYNKHDSEIYYAGLPLCDVFYYLKCRSIAISGVLASCIVCILQLHRRLVYRLSIHNKRSIQLKLQLTIDLKAVFINFIKNFFIILKFRLWPLDQMTRGSTVGWSFQVKTRNMCFFLFRYTCKKNVDTPNLQRHDPSQNSPLARFSVIFYFCIDS